VFVLPLIDFSKKIKYNIYMIKEEKEKNHMEVLDKLVSLIDYLNARTAEYDEGHPTISDKEYDDKYFELVALETKLGCTFNTSPTQKIIYNTVNALEKVEHSHPMLSLDKTKDIEDVKSFVGKNTVLAMCKMDGLTCSLTYQGGKLVKAETRGNGTIGENVLHNAKVIPTIPKYIPYRDTLVIDGEIICTWDDFADFSKDYKNPRNFAAGSIRLLEASECEKRKLTFVAWDVIEGFNEHNSLSEKLNYLQALRFLVAPFIKFAEDVVNEVVNAPNMIMSLAQIKKYPIDGVVFKFDDIEYGKSLGSTAHHFKNAIAYKFYDETYETKLIDIEWTMGRTGILTPVAIFEPIEIDGSTIERSSLHNISIMRETLGKSYKGQKVWVSKRNMIIPQIEFADKEEPNISVEYFEIPQICPICGGSVEIQESDSSTKNLVCVNPQCQGKLINQLDHFCGKKGLDIKGLSLATLDKLVDWGWVNNISDIMILSNHRNEWIQKPGFGEKSVDKILDAIENAKNPTLDTFIASLGIPLIGRTVSKELIKHIDSYEDFVQKAQEKFDFSAYDGFAESKTNAIWEFDFTEANKVYQYLSIGTVVTNTEQSNNCKDLKIVITGKLQQFKNRDALKKYIEERGGKVVDSVSKNTTYLINNDVNSTSSKNQTAKKLGIPILTEQEFVEKFS
jgi:DNA ligase (NAD+)